MDKQDLERRLEAAEKQNIGLLDEIKNLKAKLADMQDEPEIPDMPYFRSGKQWWYVETEGSLVESVTIHDSKRIEFNCFHTEAYAQELAKKCKLIAMMLHCKWYLDRDYVPDWNNHNEEKFYTNFNHDKNEFVTCACGSRYIDGGRVFFSTVEKAQKCADWLNKHWKENENE